MIFGHFPTPQFRPPLKALLANNSIFLSRFLEVRRIQPTIFCEEATIVLLCLLKVRSSIVIMSRSFNLPWYNDVYYVLASISSSPLQRSSNLPGRLNYFRFNLFHFYKWDFHFFFSNQVWTMIWSSGLRVPLRRITMRNSRSASTVP